MSRKQWTITSRIVAIYAAFGIAWIYGSDSALGWLVNDSAVIVKIAVIKDTLFIVCTAILLFLLINRFIQQLTTAENLQIENLKNYETIFNATNEAIFVHDAQSGQILDINNRMLEIFGYERAEAMMVTIGTISEGTFPYSQDEASEKMRKASNEGPQVFNWLCRRKNGELFWTEVSLRRITTQGYDKIIAVVRDISDRILAEKARDESLDLLRKITDRIPGIVYQFCLRPDGSSCFPFINEYIREMHRIEPEDVREDASKVFAMIHPDDYDNVASSIQKSARELTPWCQEYRVKCDDGTVRWYSGSSIPQRVANGSVLWHGFASDITDRKEKDKVLCQAIVAADSSNRAKSQFLANMSHELLTPMNGILGMSQLLKMTSLNTEQQGYADVIIQSGEKLTTVINDIIDFSKMDAGELGICLSEFDMHQSITEIVKIHTIAAQMNGLTLNVVVNADIPPKLMGDQLRVKQILHNLLDNAVKFTEQGGISISVERLKQNGESVIVQISVQDSGIGISASDLEKIFQSFTQVDGSRTRKYEGTGLGLSICRHLVTLLGGSISVESLLGTGSCFKAVIPFSIIDNVNNEKIIKASTYEIGEVA